MTRRAWILLAVMIALVPLGLLSNASAWGEWEPEHYLKILGFIPEGIRQTHSFSAPLPDYTLPGVGSTLSYYLSALLGLILLGGIYWALYRFAKRKRS